MDLKGFFDALIFFLQGCIALVIALAFLSAYYEVKHEWKQIESNHSQNQEINGTPNVPR